MGQNNMKYLLAVIITINTAVSGDYVKSHLNTPVVINRIVSMQVTGSNSYVDAVNPISLPLQGVRNDNLQPAQWRQFKFADNTDRYIPAKSSVSRQFRTAVTTKTFIGVVDLSFRIDQNGSVVLTNVGE